MELYSKEAFKQQQLDLNFIKMDMLTYPQFKNEFMPNLSVLDVLMFNPPAAVKTMLIQYRFV